MTSGVKEFLEKSEPNAARTLLHGYAAAAAERCKYRFWDRPKTGKQKVHKPIQLVPAAPDGRASLEK